MLTLFYTPGTASFVVHWLLLELRAEHQLRKINTQAKEHKTPEYLKLNPNGVIPTLLVDDKPLFESGAIISYLVDAYPESGLAPAPGTFKRGEYYQWMFYLVNQLQPAFRFWFYPQEAAGEANADTSKAAAEEKIQRIFDKLDAHLSVNGPYLLGDNISAADFMLTMLMRWSRNMPKPATQWPALNALALQMKARPSFKELYAREELTEWA
jgi:glutathione S-transferase